ncbi:hypothetical protein [Streptomyces niveus]
MDAAVRAELFRIELLRSWIAEGSSLALPYTARFTRGRPPISISG